jgi:hypothetical protein
MLNRPKLFFWFCVIFYCLLILTGIFSEIFALKNQLIILSKKISVLTESTNVLKDAIDVASEQTKILNDDINSKNLESSSRKKQNIAIIIGVILAIIAFKLGY